MGVVLGYVGQGDEALLLGMLGRLAHRGGPIRELVATPGFGFASARRAAAGEVEASGGPGQSRDGRVSCVIEGRLLNEAALVEELRQRGVELREREAPSGGPSASELVANLVMTHGEDAFALLDGAFTVAVRSGDTVYLARDALGEKPLYYGEVGGTLLFASEIKAFLAAPGFVSVPDLDSLTKLLVFSFVPGERTMFRGVSQLMPGTTLRLREGRIEALASWDVKEEIEAHDEAAFADQIRAGVEAAVERRIPPSRRVGAFLSGGVDSSAVVAVLRSRGVDVTTFSASFGHGNPNELFYARLVAEHCGVPHRVIDVEPDDFLDLLPDVIYGLDDPLCDCITVPNYILAREAAREFSVVFNGEGGDPLFGGPKNKFLILGEWYRPFGGYDRARAYLSSYHKFYDHLGDALTPELQARTGGARALEEEIRGYLDDPTVSHFLNRLMRLNIKLKGGQNILVKVDKMLSANGVEPASPLFDRALAELSFKLPPALKRRGDIEKYAFKKAVESLLPRQIVYRKKAGMGVPLNQWFRASSLGGYTRDLLTSKRALERGYFQASFVRELLDGRGAPHGFGQDRSGELLWMLLAIELWHRVFVDGEGKR